MKRLFSFVCVFTFLMAFAVYAQYSDGSDQKKEDAQVQAEDSQDQPFLEQLKAYVAVAKDDVSFCTGRVCKDRAERILQFRNFGEGKCSQVVENMRDHCEKFKSHSCAAFAEPNEQEMCQGRFPGSVDALSTVQKNYNMESLEELAMSFSVILGYQKHDSGACEKLVTKYISSKKPEYFSCSILFSSDPQRAFEKIEADFKLVDLARKRNDSEICKQIKDLAVMQECYRQPFQSRADDTASDSDRK
ncbi:MAG: hypothetical protein HQL16_03765 [Candidatus Omnitrophica bacterium]|nr:hypothetical protein [Candidatus Omnitrophota bacterium]